MSWKPSLIPCAVFLLIIFIVQSIETTTSSLAINQSEHMKKTTNPHFSSYTLHGPVIIGSDEDFIAQGWPGNGTEANPYLIEGLYIEDQYTGIDISNTRVFFEIRHCLIDWPYYGYPENRTGIKLSNVTNGIVRNAHVSKNSIAILIEDSHGLAFANNIVIRTQRQGFYLSDSRNATLINNVVSITAGNSFYFRNSRYVTLINNTAMSYGYARHGFNLENSDWFTLINNTATRNEGHGYYLKASSHCTLTGNIAKNNTQSGYLLSLTHSCTLRNNTAQYNSQHGFFFKDSYSHTLEDNMSNENQGNGYYFDTSDGNTLNSNSASANSYSGFYLVDVEMCVLSENRATNNARSGFYLRTSQWNSLSENTASDNFDSGFFLNWSNWNTLVANTATGNLRSGICIVTFSYSNRLHLNWLGHNGESNGRDDGEANFWDDGVSSGNYWNDYTGIGAYPVVGSAGSVDNFPFSWTDSDATATITEPDQEWPHWELVIVLGVIVAAFISLAVIIHHLKQDHIQNPIGNNGAN